MARTLLLPTPPDVPPSNTRLWYPTTRQGLPSLRVKPRTNKPSPLTTDPTAFNIWGEKYAPLIRGYISLTSSWWTQGLEYGGPTWWDYVATLQPITTYRGQTKTATGREWFMWYQKKSLCSSALNAESYQTNPIYDRGPEDPTNYNYPDYPRLPWAPPPPPSWTFTGIPYPAYITATVHAPSLPHTTVLITYFSIVPPGIAAADNPHYQNSLVSWFIPPAYPTDWNLWFRPSQLKWSWTTGIDAYMGLFYFDHYTRQPGPVAWKIVRA